MPLPEHRVQTQLGFCLAILLLIHRRVPFLVIYGFCKQLFLFSILSSSLSLTLRGQWFHLDSDQQDYQVSISLIFHQSLVTLNILSLEEAWEWSKAGALIRAPQLFNLIGVTLGRLLTHFVLKFSVSWGNYRLYHISLI